jgi:hypothetical protein
LNAELWEKKIIDDPIQFWRLASAYAPELADFALRLFHTPPNPVPSERAISTMNLNFGNTNSKLKLETLDKLYFIHINRRILDRKSGEKKSFHELTEEEEIMIKDRLNVMEEEELAETLAGDITNYHEEVKEVDLNERPVKRRRIDTADVSLPGISTFFRPGSCT